MNDTQRAIRQALDRVKVVDPHCHLRPEKPSADDLADIVLYHHVWIELVSSGMSPFEVTRAGLPHEVASPDMPPLERVRRALKYLANIKTTTLGLLLRWLLRDLYDLDDLTDANLEPTFDLVQTRGADPRWQEEVLRTRCGIESSITVEGGTPYSDMIFKGREGLPANLASGKQTPFEALSSWESIFGRELNHASDYVDFLTETMESLPENEYKFLGWWVVPYVTGELAEEDRVTRILNKVKNRQPLSHAEIGSVCFFGVRAALNALRKRELRTIQLILGAEVLPPHRSITQWHGNFTGAIARIANEFEDFHFNISSASDLFTHDLGALAKHIPNISVAGYWWHTLYPFYIRKSLETRLDMVPLNKIIAYFSDAYHAEWCYPKLKMVKQIVEEILLERIDRGWYRVDTAVEIVEKIFHENPKRIYGV